MEELNNGNFDYGSYQNYFNSFFFIMTTISSIGYFSPVTSLIGKVSIIALMAFVVAVIPNQS